MITPQTAERGKLDFFFLAEGLLIGFIAWTLGVLLSLPISWLLSNALG